MIVEHLNHKWTVIGLSLVVDEGRIHLKTFFREIKDQTSKSTVITHPMIPLVAQINDGVTGMIVDERPERIQLKRSKIKLHWPSEKQLKQKKTNGALLGPLRNDELGLSRESIHLQCFYFVYFCFVLQKKSQNSSLIQSQCSLDSPSLVSNLPQQH